MTARLGGSNDFNIDPPGPVTKSLFGDGRATWSWQVAPKNANQKQRTLTIEAWVDIGADKDSFQTIYEEVSIAAPESSMISKVPEMTDKFLKSADALNRILALLGFAGGLSGLFAWLRKRFMNEETPVTPAAQ